MRRVDIVKRASKNLSKSKLRTILTSLAIAVGATTISLALAAGKGGNAYVSDLANKIGDKNSISIARKIKSEKESDPYELKAQNSEGEASSSEKEKATLSGFEKYALKQSDIQKIQKVKGVDKISPFVNINVETARLDGGQKIVVGAVTKNDSKQVEFSAGKLNDKFEIPTGKAIAPKSFAKAVKMKEQDLIDKKVIFEIKNSIGETIEETFEIVAVDNGKTEMEFSYPNAFRISNSDGLQISKKTNAEMANYFGGINVSVKNGFTPQQVAEEIRKADVERFEVSSFADSYKTVQSAINVAAAGLAGFGALAILASVFGIINTQYISVLERTSQIGLMKSLGAKKSDISKMFRYEAAWIGFLGGAIGVIIAGVFSSILNPLMSNSGIFSIKSDVSLLQMDWVASAVMVLCLMVVAVVSGYLPARKAAKMNPIEALRTE